MLNNRLLRAAERVVLRKHDIALLHSSAVSPDYRIAILRSKTLGIREPIGQKAEVLLWLERSWLVALYYSQECRTSIHWAISIDDLL